LVQSLASFGKGVPDLLVQTAMMRNLRLLEVKSEDGELTEDQEKWIAKGWVVHVVRTPAEALRACGFDVQEKS
jgi:hypothetical protein